MKTEFTPGTGHATVSESSVADKYGMILADCSRSLRKNSMGGNDPRNKDEIKANARLIAAAPDLLRALELAKVDLIAMGMDVGHNHMLKIDTALEKAKGKSQ